MRHPAPPSTAAVAATSRWRGVTALLWLAACAGSTCAAPPDPPLEFRVSDRPRDKGASFEVSFRLPDSDRLPPADGATPIVYVIERASELPGLFTAVASIEPTDPDYTRGVVTTVVDKQVRGRPYWFRMVAENADGELSATVAPLNPLPVRATRDAFDGSRFWLLVLTLLVCGSVIGFVLLARWGWPLKVRRIAGLEAVEDAVGRATEMGRACLFVPGIQDMNEMQTIAGLTILSRVAERAAEYDCLLETPTSKSLVMTAARETVAAAFSAAGRPEAYNPDLVYYVTDEQFAYVSFLTGKMVREKPAACFYLGSFFAESLILAETGNAVGAIQVAGTAQPAQLPFFVAACDYTLIGEEFFAASAYLSKDPDQLGSLKGQDAGKLIAGVLILLGVALWTGAELTGSIWLEQSTIYLRDVVLHAGE